LKCQLCDLVMKASFDNFCTSITQRNMKRPKAKGWWIGYGPVLKNLEFFRSEMLTDLAEFKRRVDLILAIRRTQVPLDAEDKSYPKDLFFSDAQELI